MKCLFCPNVSLKRETFFEYYKCFQCETSFDILQDKVISYKLFKKINKKMFIIEYNSHDNATFIYSSSPKPGLVLKLDGVANITPHNISSKLPTIINFS